MSRRSFLKLMPLTLAAAACRRVQAIATPAFTGTPSPTPFQPQSSPAAAGTATPTQTQQPADTAAPSPSPEPTAARADHAAYIPGLIIDGHQDIAWNALEFGRDPTLSAYRIRAQEQSTSIPRLIGQRTTGLPEYQQGRLGILFATIFVLPEDYAYPGYNKMTNANPRQAEAHGREQIDYYRQLVEREPSMALIQDRVNLDGVLQGWREGRSGGNAQVGLVLCMEGAGPILRPADLPVWYQAGLRVIGPAWKRTRYAGGTGAPGPLTSAGLDLLNEMAALNMVLDLSHLAEKAYLEAVDGYPGPLIASHSNPRKFLPGDRGLSDEMIVKLAERDGVLGVVLYNAYLKPGWQRSHGRESVTSGTAADVVDHVVQLLGSTRHVALGSDFDGGFGLESIPADMDSIADLGKIAAALEKRGYSEGDIGAILNGNWLRVLRQALH